MIITPKSHRLTLAASVIVTCSIAVLAAAALLQLRAVEEASADYHSAGDVLVLVERLRGIIESKVSAARGFVLSGHGAFLTRAEEARSEYSERLLELRNAAGRPRQGQLLDAVASAEREHEAAVDELVHLRRLQGNAQEVELLFDTRVTPRRRAVVGALQALLEDTRGVRDQKRAEYVRALRHATWGIGAMAALALLAALGVAFVQVRASRREQQVLERWTEFLSVASHDVKSPLATLTLQVQVLERLLAAQGVTDGAPLDMLGRMKRQVSRMATLVANVLDVSRLRLGTMQLDAAPTDLAELVTQAAERLREQFVQEGTPLTVMASESITGQWDRLRLEQVVLNLLSNALKYGDHQPVRVVVDGDADSARLTVRDHGSGIPVDEQIRIFDRGARVRGERRPGHGLGLWITRTIVDAHGGKITIESSPGLGSTFVVELPRAEQASSRPSALRALLSGARQEGAAQSRR